MYFSTLKQLVKHNTTNIKGQYFPFLGIFTDDNSTAQLLNEMSKPCFDSIRKGSEFKELTKRLKKTASKWNRKNTSSQSIATLL